MDLEAMKAQFAAKGGKVQQIAEGEGLGLTARDWGQVVRTPRAEADDLISQRHVTRDHMGREFVTNGLGERLS